MPKKNYGRKFLSVLVVLVMLCTSVVGGHVKAANPGSTTVFDKNGLKVDFKVDNQWVGFFNGTMTVTNTGTQPVEDWAFTFDFPHEITNIWNAGILEHQQGVYTVKNLEWNQDIPVGDSISFGFTAAVSGNITYPTFFTVNTKTAVVPSALVKVEYVLYSDWGSGYSAALKITNPSQTKIEDWTIDFDFARSISTLSCGKILAHDGTHYTIQNDGSTQNLSAGQTIQLGLVGTGGIASNVPAGSIVKQIVRGFDLVSDTDGDLVLDWVEICVNGTDPLVPDGTTPTPTPTPSATPTPTPPEDMVTDTDGDLIPDYYEAILGTDPTLVDTDKDGLSDYDEIFLLGFNPLSTDSDGNGILDYDEDVDHDGLSFRQEAQAGTDSYNKDTDADGLLDGEEINTYGTNPLVADVDGDGLVDGDEIALSLDPTNPATHGVPDSEYTQTHSLTSDSAVLKDVNTEASPFTLSIDVNAAGNVEKNLTVSESKYSTVMQNDAILGVIPELDYDDSYKTESVTLKFQIKDGYIENSNGQYAAVNPEYEGIKRYNVFRYFEDINMLLPVETHFDLANQTVYAETDAFGTYCIIDMEVWLDSIGILPEDVAVGTSQAASDLTLNEVNTLDQTATLMASAGSTQSKSSAKVKEGIYNGHRYALLDKGLTWDDAKAYCEYMAGHLATITSQGEQDYVSSLLAFGTKNSYWIGAEMNPNRSYTKWITGEAMSYMHWYTRQPDHCGNQEDALMMYKNNNGDGTCFGWWNDLNRDGTCLGQPFFGTNNLGLLCEWETPVNLVYGTSLKLCNSATELSKISDQDWDNDGIPNWKEVNSSLNLGYWNVDGAYIPASFANFITLKSSQKGMLDAFSRLNINPLFISVIPLNSDPENADSDGDGYKDNVDPRPNKSDVTKIGLANGESYEYDKYISIYDITPDKYGGSQMWFQYYPDPAMGYVDYMITQHGCGLIAFADQLLYWAIQTGSNNQSTETDVALQDSQGISLANYMKYVRSLYSSRLDAGITGPNGLIIQDALNRYAETFTIDYTAQWEMNIGRDKMLNEIEDMLQNNIPVMMSIGPNTKQLLFTSIVEQIRNGFVPDGIPFKKLLDTNDAKYDSSNTKEYYQFIDTKDDNVCGHYFTITGILSDEVSDKIMLRISSWGIEYYLDYDEYSEYVNQVGDPITSSIMNIEKYNL